MLFSYPLESCQSANCGFKLQDISTLGVVNIRYCGYIAVVKVNHHEKSEVDLSLPSPLITDHPEGGANALNINRCLSVYKHILQKSEFILYAVFFLCVTLDFFFQPENASSQKPCNKREKLIW